MEFYVQQNYHFAQRSPTFLNFKRIYSLTSSAWTLGIKVYNEEFEGVLKRMWKTITI